MTIEIEGVSLPDGWAWEPLRGSGDQILITSPGPRGGMITIDFDRRGFKLGLGIVHGSRSSEGTYKGRGWKRALVAAAVKRLDQVIG